MRLYKDNWNDLVSDDFDSNYNYISYGEFRQRSWGFYYYNFSYNIIRLYKEYNDNKIIIINRYYL